MKSITPAELRSWMQSNKQFQLLDVREGFERTLYNIGGFHIPLAELVMRQKELSAHIPLIIYCEKGVRSAIAGQRLEGYGFMDIYNLSGGMRAWTKAHD